MTYNVLSMFCGGGGFDLGFKQSGFDIIWANDVDKDACRTYRRNFGNKHLTEGDITKIPIPTLEQPVHVLLAGFPCQPFSSTGNRLSGDDSRGRLYKTCMDYIGKFQPQVVFFENVRGVLKSQGIERKYIIEDICDDLLGLSYEHVYISLIEATMYGVPQKRQRVIVTASRMPFIFPQPIAEELNSLA